jgi:hypothetical protein
MNNLSCDLEALNAIIIMGSKAFNVHSSSLATIGFQAIKWTNDKFHEFFVSNLSPNLAKLSSHG